MAPSSENESALALNYTSDDNNFNLTTTNPTISDDNNNNNGGGDDDDDDEGSSSSSDSICKSKGKSRSGAKVKANVTEEEAATQMEATATAVCQTAAETPLSPAATIAIATATNTMKTPKRQTSRNDNKRAEERKVPLAVDGEFAKRALFDAKQSLVMTTAGSSIVDCLQTATATASAFASTSASGMPNSVEGHSKSVPLKSTPAPDEAANSKTRQLPTTNSSGSSDKTTASTSLVGVAATPTEESDLKQKQKQQLKLRLKLSPIVLPGDGTKRRSPLSLAKSLEGTPASSSNSGGCNATATNTASTTAAPSTTTATTTSGQRGLQAPQMFNLRQLALNTRNLAKKRSSIQAGEQSQQQQQSDGSKLQGASKWLSVRQDGSNAFARPFEYSTGQNPRSNSNSSSSSSVDTLEPARAAERFGRNVTARESGANDSDLEGNANSGENGGADEDNGQTRGYDEQEDGNDGRDNANEGGDDEGEDEDNEEEDDEDDDESSDDDDDDDNDENDDDDDYDDDDNSSDDAGRRRGKGRKSPNECTNGTRKRIGGHLRYRGRQIDFRRESCCNCEPIINKIDHDGLPVTDVDLVTYKDLCQIEQHAHRMRTYQRQHECQLHNNHQADAQSIHAYRPHKFTANMRRSSLQEESNAYYELCTSGEEQLIRQKYTWFPPSLQRLVQIDKFFANFPREKIPLTPNAGGAISQQQHRGSLVGGQRKASGSVALSSSSSTTKSPAVTTNTTGKVTSGEAASSTSVSSPRGQHHPAVTSSYRDEQISFQLPRQDISLDYCSYHMTDASRTAYQQFVDKRNGQALDVGTVVQVRIYFGGATNSDQQQQQQRQRKASCMSQSSAAMALLALNQSQQELVGFGQHVATGSGAQRCRRCLVRFEDKQLAVAAPNFIIGSVLYRPNAIIPLAAATTTTTATTPMSLDIIARRASSSCQTSDRISLKLKDPSLAAGATPSPGGATQQPPNAALFHPICFTCSTCKEFLVDLVYCLRDNKLYCLRHYGESLRPRCNWCQELIFSDEYLKAMNESFHVDHFLCRHCDCNLAGQRYVLKDEKPFCISCYEGNFANTCEDCQKAIGIDSRDLSYKDRHWHDTCFLCNKCQQSLIDKPFGSKADKVYCADCYDITFATRCDGCKNPFRAGSKKMEYRGKQWHDSCFCCCVCQNTIGSNSFIPKNEEIYCIKCYEDKYATRCTKCKQVIVSGGVTFRNEPWHRDCFKCCNCDKSLAGQRFTTRDVKNETVKDTNKTNQPHNAYCIDCYGELFAKKCYACSQAITGLGGTRFVTFEDRSWHNDCFICNDCNTSLVGKGFITDGPEAILCGECARAKLRY